MKIEKKKKINMELANTITKMKTTMKILNFNKH